MKWEYASLSSESRLAMVGGKWEWSTTFTFVVRNIVVAIWTQSTPNERPPLEIGSVAGNPFTPNRSNPNLWAGIDTPFDLLGRQGWELCLESVSRTALFPGSAVGTYQTTASIPVDRSWAFKRPLA
jgi:hypothetical protein